MSASIELGYELNYGAGGHADKKMKYCSTLTMSAHHQNEAEVESLLMSPCWSQAHAGGPTDQYLLDGHKLLLDHDLDSLPSSDTEVQKSTIDALDNLLLSGSHHTSINASLAELKPLPPFTGYTGHLSINGISGHHYHAIAQRLPDDHNNNNNSNNNNLNNSTNNSSCIGNNSSNNNSNNNNNSSSYSQLHHGNNSSSYNHHHHNHHHHNNNNNSNSNNNNSNNNSRNNSNNNNSTNSNSNIGGSCNGVSPNIDSNNNHSSSNTLSSTPTTNNNNNNNNNNSCTSRSSSTHTTPGAGTDHNIVSSSTTTCLPDSVLSPDESSCLHDVKLFSGDATPVGDAHNKMYSVADSCVMTNGNNSSSNGGGVNNSHHHGRGGESGPDSVSQGLKIYAGEGKELHEYDMSSIEDIAAIIGSAIADTTVPNQIDTDNDNNNTESRDSWMDLDAWIDGACVQQDGKLIISHQDSLNDFMMPQSPHSLNGIIQGSGSTLQNLLTHMPLLQNRLQNGPPMLMNNNLNNNNSSNNINNNNLSNKGSETPSSSTPYCNGDLISMSTSPPGSVVSTTDNILLGGQSRYLSQQHTNINSPHHYQLSMNIKAEGLCSPDLLSNNNNSSASNNNYPHTTSILGNNNSPSSMQHQQHQHQQQASKMKRSRSQKQKMGQQTVLGGLHTVSSGGGVNSAGGGGGGSGCGGGDMTPNSGPMSPTGTSMSLNFQGGNDLSGLLGKEKPVHRCTICNRGFLNKSNIKVHLRTHTGEKPFRCEVCSKAFRQKAHLIKHQQIHKRIGRD